MAPAVVVIVPSSHDGSIIADVVGAGRLKEVLSRHQLDGVGGGIPYESARGATAIPNQSTHERCCGIHAPRAIALSITVEAEAPHRWVVYDRIDVVQRGLGLRNTVQVDQRAAGHHCAISGDARVSTDTLSGRNRLLKCNHPSVFGPVPIVHIILSSHHRAVGATVEGVCIWNGSKEEQFAGVRRGNEGRGGGDGKGGECSVHWGVAVRLKARQTQ